MRILTPDDTLSKAVGVLQVAQAHALPVTTNGRIVGLVTEESVLRRVASGVTDDATVAEVMERQPPCANIYMTVGQAAEMMNVTGAHTLPVIDEFGSFRGLVVRSDVLAATMDVVRPPSIAGMATPLGVHLTTGAISAGAGSLGLFLTGVALMMRLEFAKIVLWYGSVGLDKLFHLNLVALQRSPAIGGYGFAVLRLDWIHIVIPILQYALMFLFLRISGLAGYHAAEHMVVHTIEAGEPLTPESVSRMPRAHPRCGTNLMGAAVLILMAANVFGPDYGLLMGLVLIFGGWRTVGYYLQQYVTTKKPTLRQLKNGISVGSELLEKYRRTPHAPMNGFTRIWNMGVPQVGLGFVSVVLLDGLISKLLGMPGLF